MTKQPDDSRELARSVTGDLVELLLEALAHPQAPPANRLSAACTESLSSNPRART